MLAQLICLRPRQLGDPSALKSHLSESLAERSDRGRAAREHDRHSEGIEHRDPVEHVPVVLRDLVEAVEDQ
eukprot:7147947-Prymnesium_polylepis.1